MGESFSERHGYGVVDADISVREDAPEALRYAIPNITTKKVGMSPTAMRKIVCEVLNERPDDDNWSDYPNVWNEVNDLIKKCPWFRVYDVAEALHADFDNSCPEYAEKFARLLNQFFREKGIGWEMINGNVVFRGSEGFAEVTKQTVSVLEESGRPNAAREMREALQDMSRRPEPDFTGAIQHAMAALEATARDVTGEPNSTLGQLIPKLGLPQPLDAAVIKLWGYASDRARHIREGQKVDAVEAELLVTVACAVCTFVIKRTNS